MGAVLRPPMIPRVAKDDVTGDVANTEDAEARRMGTGSDETLLCLD